jgi:hypothetical protein
VHFSEDRSAIFRKMISHFLNRNTLISFLSMKKVSIGKQLREQQNLAKQQLRKDKNDVIELITEAFTAVLPEINQLIKNDIIKYPNYKYYYLYRPESIGWLTRWFHKPDQATIKLNRLFDLLEQYIKRYNKGFTHANRDEWIVELSRCIQRVLADEEMSGDVYKLWSTFGGSWVITVKFSWKN